MKKFTAKLLALMLALALVLSLTACGGSDQKKLVGSWECELDFAPLYNDGMEAEEGGEYLMVESLPMVLQMTFREDGTCTMSVSKESLTNAVEIMKDAMKTGMEDYLMAMLGDAVEGLTVDDILALMGTTMDDLIDSLVTEEVIAEMADDMVSEGNYMAEDGKLYVSDSLDEAVDVAEDDYSTYTLKGDTLTLETATDMDEDSAMLYPMTFKKVG